MSHFTDGETEAPEGKPGGELGHLFLFSFICVSP